MIVWLLHPNVKKGKSKRCVSNNANEFEWKVVFAFFITMCTVYLGQTEPAS